MHINNIISLINNMSEYIPEEANRYWPSGDKLYVGSGRSIVRFIFYRTLFTDFENQMLLEFKKYLSLQNVQSLPPFYGDEELLRTIIGCKFKFKAALDAISSAIEWRHINVPYGYNSLFPKISSLIASGTIYIHGRDHRYRPLIILNAGRLDFTTHTIEDYCNLLCFTLEFAVSCLMLPGHIENWIIITDLCGQSLHSLPLSQLKTIIKTLQDNFRCRMIVNYVVNAPKTLKFMWGMIKNFVEAHTVNKIRILREGRPGEMRSHFARHQYEEKYGGTAPNAISFWPPALPTGPFEAENETVGAHLEPVRRVTTDTQYHSGKATLRNMDASGEEVFYSVSADSHEDFFSMSSDGTTEERKTVYVECEEREHGYSRTDYVAINESLSEQSEIVKQKTCCQRCNIF